MRKPIHLMLVLGAAASSAAFAGELPVAQSVATPEDADLYGIFLNKWAADHAETIHVSNIAEAPPATAIAEYAACVKGSKLVELNNPKPLQLSETALAGRKNVRLVDPKTWRPRDPEDAFASGKPISKAVSDGFAAGLLTFSRAIFDERHEVAVFTYSFVCGRLCGSGSGVVFDKTASGWKQREMPCGGWIS